MSAINRLKDFIKSKGIVPIEFERQCDLSNGYIGRQYQNKGAVGSHILEKIAKVYPELNMSWVISGNGYMIINPTKSSKEDALATLKVEEEQEIYKAKNKAADLIKEGLDLLQSTLKKEKESKKKK